VHVRKYSGHPRSPNASNISIEAPQSNVPEISGHHECGIRRDGEAARRSAQRVAGLGVGERERGHAIAGTSRGFGEPPSPLDFRGCGAPAAGPFSQPSWYFACLRKRTEDARGRRPNRAEEYVIVGGRASIVERMPEVVVGETMCAAPDDPAGPPPRGLALQISGGEKAPLAHA